MLYFSEIPRDIPCWFCSKQIPRDLVRNQSIRYSCLDCQVNYYMEWRSRQHPLYNIMTLESYFTHVRIFPKQISEDLLYSLTVDFQHNHAYIFGSFGASLRKYSLDIMQNSLQSIRNKLNNYILLS